MPHGKEDTAVLSAAGRCWAFLVAVALLAGASTPADAAGQVRGQKYFELQPGSEYATPLLLCEAVAKENRANTLVSNPYAKVVRVKDAGDSVWCELADSTGNKTDQHYGSARVKCPAGSEPGENLSCNCKDGYDARSGQCVPVSDAAKAEAVKEPRPDPSDVPPAAARGMTDVDDAVFQGIAHNKRLYILVRDSNTYAPNFNGKPGYLPKPEALKAKTRKAKLGPEGKPLPDPNVGLAAADPNDPGLQAMLAASKPPLNYTQYVIALLDQNPSFVVGRPPDYLIETFVRNPETKKTIIYRYYSDYDLHGVYDGETRQPVYDKAIEDWANPSVKELLNARFKHAMVQHGPHDDWPKNMSKEAGPNRGPQPPVTAYLPDGSMAYLADIPAMKSFYAKHKIKWPYAPDF